VVALSLAGWLVGRLGSRVATSVATVLFCLAMPLPLWSPSLTGLALTLALLGACNGLLDGSMNAQAGALQERLGRPIMSSLHALFSVGGVAGALLAAGAIGAGVGAAGHVLGAALLALLAAALALPRLSPPAPAGDGTAPVLARPSRALLGLGLLAFLGLLAEGSMADWSAVYLHDTLGASPSLAAVGFAAFSLAMAAGRFAGDALVSRFGPRAVLRASGAIAAGGLGAALLVGRPAAAILGCALVGLGIANVVPIVFGAAARVPGGEPGRALAAVATIGYLGFLCGPPLIGAAGEAAGLAIGLALVSIACALVAARAGALPRERPHVTRVARGRMRRG
jgi:MFS family permease